MKVNIYSLKDPRSNTIMYVGATTATLASRLTNHKYFANKRTSPVNLWLSGLYAQGLEPIMELLEVTNYSGWKVREEAWIAKTGVLNVSKVGTGIVTKEERSEESIERSTVDKRKEVICIDKDEVYPSVSKAAKANKVAQSAMSKALRSDGKLNGLTFAYYVAKSEPKEEISVIEKTKEDE